RSGGAGSPRRPRSLVHARFLDPAADLGEMMPVLAGVLPPALQVPDDQAALARIRAVHVPDLALAAAGRLQRADPLVDVARVAVQPDNGVAGGRRAEAGADAARLLDDVHHLAVVAVRDHSKALRVGNLLDEDLGPAGFAAPFLQRRGLRVLED